MCALNVVLKRWLVQVIGLPFSEQEFFWVWDGESDRKGEDF